MRLLDLIAQLEYAVIQSPDPSMEIEISGITYDSRETKAGDLFVCLVGNTDDGHRFLEAACREGALAVLIEKLVFEGKILAFPENVAVILVKDTREALAHISAAWFGYPVRKLKVIGVTGTKGKTTVSSMIYQLLQGMGYPAGLMGTTGTIIGEKQFLEKNTTYESFTIHKYFAKMVEMGCEYAVMEVSSQGIKYHRTDGIEFTVGIFTNLGEDHIGPGEHASIAEYCYYKSCLFRHCQIGIGNLDDPKCSYMFQRSTCRKYGFTVKKDGGEHVLSASEIEFSMGEDGPITRFAAGGTEFLMEMPGIFNVSNALAALQTIRCLGMEIRNAAEILRSAHVKGRMERISIENNIACYIDYAHNAMSLKCAIEALKVYLPKRILLVFGCGGNRARSRRLEMGEVAGESADVTILTSDNPRNEPPLKIIEDILIGMKRTDGVYFVEEDRRNAIKMAIGMAREQDVILIAGKGHEDYQEIGAVRYPMDDRGLVLEAMKERQQLESEEE